jgi:hypothetical protein
MNLVNSPPMSVEAFPIYLSADLTPGPEIPKKFAEGQALLNSGFAIGFNSRAFEQYLSEPLS